MRHVCKVAVTALLATFTGPTAVNGQSWPNAPTEAGAEAIEPSGGTGLSVYLDDDVVVRIPANVAARLQTLLRSADDRRVRAGVRELVSRYARRSPLLAEAIRRYAESRRASDPAPADPDSPDPAPADLGAMQPARADIGDLPRQSAVPARRTPGDAKDVAAPKPAMPESPSADTQRRTASAMPTSTRAARSRPVADPVGRSAERTLMTPAIGTVGPVLRQVASPVLP